MSYICKQVQKLLLVYFWLKSKQRWNRKYTKSSDHKTQRETSDESLFQCGDDSEKCLRAHQMGSQNAYRCVLIWWDTKKDKGMTGL